MGKMCDIQCESAGCTCPSYTRAGWNVTGVGWAEHELCQSHARDLWQRFGSSTLFTFSPPGVQIVNVAASRAAGRDDRAAMRDI